MIPFRDRSLYLREILQSLQSTIGPEITSDRATDALGCVQRVLAHLIVADEAGATLEIGLAERISTGVKANRPFAEALAEAQGFATGNQLQQPALRSLVDAERDYLLGMAWRRDALLKAEMDEPEAAPSCSVSAARVADYLRARLPEFPALEIADLVMIPGGRSKETLLIDIRNAGALTGRHVMRKDVAIGLNATRSCDEYVTLQLAAEAGVPVPRPLLVEDDPDQLDGTFMIVSRMSGEKKGEIFPDVCFPTEGKPEIGAQIASIVAKIHQIPPAEIGRPVPDRKALRSQILARIDAVNLRFNSVVDGEPSVLFGTAIAWLRATIDEALKGPIVLRHGDLGLHNMLIDGTVVTAVLDWELSEPGYAAADLGSLRHTVLALMGWQDFVDQYVAAGGLREAANDISVRFFSILGKVTGMANTQLGGEMFRTGSKRSIVTANSAADFRFRLALMLADELAADFG